MTTNPAMAVQLGDRRLPERFWAKVAEAESGCWLWTGTLTSHGYGYCFTGGRRRKRAHRMAYAMLVAPLNDGLPLDHLCHSASPDCPGRDDCQHRRCVNPAHLEPVTTKENLLRSPLTISGRNSRKSHCDHGHPFDEANTRYVQKPGWVERHCRACQREWARQRRVRRIAAGLTSHGLPRRPGSRYAQVGGA